MKKNGRTLKQDIAIILRGIHAFNKILPKQMWFVLVRSILTASIPFVTTAISAFLIESLATEGNRFRLICSCLVGVTVIFVLSLWKNYEDCRIGIQYSRLFNSHEINLTNKSYAMPFEVLEKSRTRKLRDEVSGSLNISGAGMASLYWDVDVLWTNMVTAIIATVIFVKSLCDMLSNNRNGALHNRHVLSLILFVMLLIVVCSFISCKMTSKRFDVTLELFLKGSEYMRYGDFYTMDYLQNEHAATDVRMYQQEELILSECQNRCYGYLAESKRKEMNAVSRYDGVKLASSCLCGCIVYILIGQKALQGVIGCGSIILLYTSVTMFIEAISRMAEIITDLRNNNEHLLKFFQYMDLPEENSICESGVAVSRNISKILYGFRFENVSFNYPESEQLVLDNINLEIPAGEKIAIVGENGSGKTTLIKLLCRLYKPTSGRILLDGKDIWEYPYEEYISMIATVFQDFSLYAFTVAENVAASQEYDKEKVVNALRKAGILAKVETYDKGIEQSLFHDFDENGTDLSGGEAQKVAIARAVYKDAEVMILDEPTAALDPYAEYEIYKNFGEISVGKTVISISHRLSSCRMCDYIVVLHQGRVTQCGSHEELVQNVNGKYFELWNAQAQYYN